MPPHAVMYCVVDPGVGGSRLPMVAEIDGRLFVGPDNGLFELVARRANFGRERGAHAVQAWRIGWRPGRLSATFHGRDLFAPIAGRLARGLRPEQVGCVAMEFPRRPDFPDDLPEIIYVDHYGNGLTGLRAASVETDRSVVVDDTRVVMNARHYAEMPEGSAFWYENSIGLVEVAVSGGRADVILGIGVGTRVSLG
jgi:S-adenosylmethionine hydrolase